MKNSLLNRGKASLAAALLTLPLTAGCVFTNSCVARGTRVFTPQGWRRIEELEVGDVVYSVNIDATTLVEVSITETRMATREVGALSAAGTTLRVTSDHPVYSPETGDYRYAGDFLLGELTQLAFIEGGELVKREVEGALTFVGVEDVFDITVDGGHHNFIAEGILVHNKSPACDNNCVEYEEDAGADDGAADAESDAAIEDVSADVTENEDLGNDEGQSDTGNTDMGADGSGDSDAATDMAGD